MKIQGELDPAEANKLQEILSYAPPRADLDPWVSAIYRDLMWLAVRVKEMSTP